MRFGFFFHEAVRALTRNAVPSFAAMATVLVTVLVLGVFIPVVQATTGAANEVRSRVMADVYLVSNVKPAEVARVRGIIENETPHVKRVVYIPKEKAIAAERKAGRGAYYDLLGANPLPDTFRDLSRQAGQHLQDPQRAGAALAVRRAHGDRPRRSTRSATARRTPTRSSPPRAW